MKIFFVNISLILAISLSQAYAQISPGDLSAVHAELEGMSNCTLCHDLGEKVSNQKCLDCHKDIQTLLDQNRGYHSNNTVLRQDCFECHSEHHGRRFDMTRFDEENFNHDLTGYNLEGAHGTIDCRECHASENIQNIDIRNRKGTYLGLEQQCLTCHDDYHQETLSQDCMECHNFEAFEPAGNFNHDDTDYPLTGEHVSVECIECHAMTSRNGQDFQTFHGVDFVDCKSCHDDPHQNRIAGDCKSCHTETAFSDFIGNNRFNHNTTDFTLRGKHDDINCFECHTSNSNARLVFGDKPNIEENQCVSCHEDVHEGRFGENCVQCHGEQSFLALKDMESFNHSVTDYPLEGMHLQVDCKQCHTGRYSEPIDFTECNHCHQDYHQGEFMANGLNPDCQECHTLDKGFDFSLYTLAQHQETAFPLEGAHIATPCFACHISEDEDRWTFRSLGSTCVDCHEDIHQDIISDHYYPEQACVNCHINDAWDQVNFDHSQTNWPLEGGHITVDCRACHFEVATSNTILKQTFKALDHRCESCHENIHDDAFAINGITDCERCHVTASWFPDKFDHNTTAFPLEGRHAEIECKACHESTNETGQTIIVYKIEKFECIDCHQ